jgi:Na+/proline symporter
MIILFVVCIIYTLIGGLRAVIGTDFIQATLILVTLIVVAVVAYITVGPGEVYAGVLENAPDRFNLLLPAGLLFAWNTALWCMGEIFHGNIWWQRIYAQRPEVTVRSFYISGIVWLFVPVVTGLLALFAIAQNLDIPQVNMVFPIVASTLLGKVGAVLVLIIVFSSLTSTADSIMASTSDFLAEDVFRQMINRKATDAQMLRVAKILIIVLGIAGIAIASFQFQSIYLFFMLTGPLVGSTVWPIILGVYWKQANKWGAFFGFILGSAAGLLSYYLFAPYSSAVVGTVVSAIVVVLFTLFSPDKFNWNNFRELESLKEGER